MNLIVVTSLSHVGKVLKMCVCVFLYKYSNTVDGRNPAPVDMEKIPFSLGFIDNKWCRISSINSITLWYSPVCEFHFNQLCLYSYSL